MLVIKYEDEKSFFYIFKYLIDFYGFNPSIINIDSLALDKFLNKKILFTNKPKIIKPFFHFSQSLIRKMKNLKILNKNLNKNAFAILNNIQIIFSINTNLFDNYVKFNQLF